MSDKPEPGDDGFKYSGKRMTLTVDFPVEWPGWAVEDALTEIAADIAFRNRTTNRKRDAKFMPKWTLDKNGAEL